MLTEDPPGWDICYTKAILYWYEANDYAIYDNGGAATWAANPSPIDTHWYVDLQQTWRDDDTWGGGVGQKAIGSFSNSDFQEDDEYTYVDHEVTVWGYKNGTIDYEAIEEARGEASLLLTSRVEIF